MQKNGKPFWLCRECQAKRARTYLEQNRAKLTKQGLARRDLRKQIIREYLLAHPCIDCGEADILVLDFDHVRGEKLGDISQMVSNNRRLADIQAEIAKCEIRCANCHRRKTAKQMGWNRRLEVRA